MAKATSGAAADAEFPIHWKEFHPKNFWQRIKACHSMISAVQKHECNLVEKFSYQSSVEDEPPQGKAEEPSKEKAAGADMEEDKRADNHQHMSKSPLHAPVENTVETKPEQAGEITHSNFKEDEDAEEPHLTCCDLCLSCCKFL
uniref:uncharacterized protein LOC103791347 isoform X6 n=1 Tax=Callithrix jacchus TaxID=9483 RepID=UPI00159EB4D3|nr:uncharacterized protein LOC103791347 isoform X6 [Callithrix jacchus]